MATKKKPGDAPRHAPSRLDRMRERADIAEAKARAAQANIRRTMTTMAAKRLAAINGTLSASDPEFNAISRAAARYGSARVTRVNDPGPRSGGGSANYQLSTPDRAAMRERCQQHRQDNPLYRTLVSRLCDIVVADGPTFSPQSADPAWNEKVAELYARRFEGENVGGIGTVEITGRMSGTDLFSAVIEAACTDGDSLIMRTPMGNQIIEAERIVNPGMVMNTRTMIDGVKVDEYGRPVSFYIGEWSEQGAFVPLSASAIKEFDARACSLMANPMHLRAGQVRGEPAMQALLVHLEGLRRYMANTAKLAEIATWIGLLIESKNPDAQQASLETAVVDAARAEGNGPTVIGSQASGDPLSDIELGTGWVGTVPAGTTAKQVEPEYPTTNYGDYIKAGMMVASAEIGLPFALAFFDGSQLSYAQLKALMISAQPGIWRWQQWLTRGVARPDYVTSVARWIAAGLIPAVKDWDKVDVIWPDMPVLDLAAEIDAFITGVENNLITKSDIVARLGRRSFRTICDARAVEREMERSRGILPIAAPGAKVLDTRPGAETQAGDVGESGGQARAEDPGQQGDEAPDPSQL